MIDDTEQLLADHDRNTRLVAETVFRLVERGAREGMTPVAVFEGAIRGGALAMALGNGDSPQEIADCLDEIAETLRAMHADAFKPVCN